MGGLEDLAFEDFVKTRCARATQGFDGDGGVVTPFTRYYCRNGFEVFKGFTCHVADPG
jgi:hypothetical protein